MLLTFWNGNSCIKQVISEAIYYSYPFVHFTSISFFFLLFIYFTLVEQNCLLIGFNYFPTGTYLKQHVLFFFFFSAKML